VYEVEVTVNRGQASTGAKAVMMRKWYPDEGQQLVSLAIEKSIIVILVV
jgi:hypothetical protein